MNHMTAKGWLTEAERTLLFESAKGAKTILNIGIEYGASLHCLRNGAGMTATLYAMDLIGDDKLDGNPSAIIVRGDSGEIVSTWNMPIDLIFIDGDHGYAGVTADCGYLEHVEVGGMAIFHDCYAAEEAEIVPHRICPGVTKAVDDWYAGVGESWIEQERVSSCRVFARVA